MFRKLPQPIYTGGLEFHIGIQSPRDGVLNDGLLLLGQQTNQLLFCSDGLSNQPVVIVQKLDDGGLFGGGGGFWRKPDPKP